MNLKAFNKTKKYILAHPKELYMDNFLLDLTKEDKIDNTDYEDRPLKHLACGTVGCIAGTGLLCSLPASERPKTNVEVCNFIENTNFGEAGAKLFDIPAEEASALFYFPFKTQEQDAERYENSISAAYSEVRARLKKFAPGTKKYAQTVVDAIDICIERNREKKIVIPEKSYDG